MLYVAFNSEGFLRIKFSRLPSSEFPVQGKCFKWLLSLGNFSLLNWPQSLLGASTSAPSSQASLPCQCLSCRAWISGPLPALSKGAGLPLTPSCPVARFSFLSVRNLHWEPRLLVGIVGGSGLLVSVCTYLFTYQWRFFRGIMRRHCTTSRVMEDGVAQRSAWRFGASSLNWGLQSQAAWLSLVWPFKHPFSLPQNGYCSRKFPVAALWVSDGPQISHSWEGLACLLLRLCGDLASRNYASSVPWDARAWRDGAT